MNGLSSSQRQETDRSTDIGLLLASETLRDRRQARINLKAWAEYKGYKPAKHHRYILNEIEKFLANDDDVLLLHAPPGSGKSTYTSILLPSNYLARNKQNLIIAATHSEDFAQAWGKQVRNDILLDGPTLGIYIAPGSAASDRWGIVSGGRYYGVSPQGSISGFRADFGLIDDLFGKQQDALSETIREQRWRWFLNDFGGRLRPDGKRVLMNTRWHLADVAGRLIDQIDSGIVKGKVINLRARAEDDDPLGRKPGQYLWDDDDYGYDRFLKQREREVDPQTWTSLYQQRPIAESGDYFRADWLRTYEKLPPRNEMVFYGGSDFAVTSHGGDYTVHAVIGLDPEGRMFVVDLWRNQTASDIWVETLCDLIRKWQPMGWAVEKGQINSGVGPFLRQRQLARNAFVAFEEFATRGDKAIRAQSIRGRFAHGGVYIDKNAQYYKSLVVELLTFPLGLNDDIVDAFGLIGQMLDQLVDGTRKIPAPQRDPKDGYRSHEMTDVGSFHIL